MAIGLAEGISAGKRVESAVGDSGYRDNPPHAVGQENLIGLKEFGQREMTLSYADLLEYERTHDATTTARFVRGREYLISASPENIPARSARNMAVLVKKHDLGRRSCFPCLRVRQVTQRLEARIPVVRDVYKRQFPAIIASISMPAMPN